ncbi:MAG: hypothetical protein R6W31_10165, partial [Bacteroidales bacterium]
MIWSMALLGLLNLYSQQPSITDFLAQCERKYGSDTDLVNGEKYFYPYALSLGDPFFFPEARSAAITIHGKEFDGQLLRYDIFNQKLILDYQNVYGANSSLVLRNEWVESFAFEGQRFKRIQGPDGQTGFFQVVSEGVIECFYSWNKKYLLNLTSGVQNFYFTDPVKESFLRMEGKFFPYGNNMKFLKAFDPELQKPIKQF